MVSTTAASALILLWATSANGIFFSYPDSPTLQSQIQSKMDEISAKTGWAFSVGYVDVNGLEFGVGSGTRTPPSNLSNASSPLAPGNVSNTDTFLFGSGTKPFTAAAVMRLVEQVEPYFSTCCRSGPSVHMNCNHGTIIYRIW